MASRRESTTSRKLTSPEAKKEGAKEPGTQRAGPRSRHPWRSGRGAHTRKVTVLFRETTISSSWAAGASDTTLENARPRAAAPHPAGPSDAPDPHRGQGGSARGQGTVERTRVSAQEMMREGDREGRRSSQFKSSPKSGEDSRGQGRGDPRPPSWCGSQDHGGDAAAPGSPTFHARRLQSLKSLLRRQVTTWPTVGLLPEPPAQDGPLGAHRIL